MENVEPSVLALHERIRAMRDDEWCVTGKKLMDVLPGSTTQEWFDLKLFERHPEYWLHVYYVANPEGAKRLFRKTLVDFFSDKKSDVRSRLFDLGLNGELRDNESFSEANAFGEERYSYILLKKSCAFLRDATPLAITWVVRPLLICITKDTFTPTRRTALRVLEHWKTQTSVQEWSGTT